MSLGLASSGRFQGSSIHRAVVYKRDSLGILEIRVGLVKGVPLHFCHALLPGCKPEFATIWACKVMIDHLRCQFTVMKALLAH